MKPGPLKSSCSISVLNTIVPPVSWLCVTCTVTLAVPLAGWKLAPLSVDNWKSSSELKVSVWLEPNGGNGKFCVKNRCRTSLITIPLLNSTCQSAGLIYTEPTGGNRGCGKKYSGGGGSTVMRKLHMAVWPHASLATHVTVVVPTGKVLPLGGLQV